jgi:plastocyanin
MRPYARQSPCWTQIGRSRAARALFFALGCLGLLARSLGATLTVTVLLPDGRPLGGVVVTARPTTGPGRLAPPMQAVMDQIDRSFEPDLLVVPLNSTVAFPNSDTVSHQIYSFSPAKRFQLPLYRGKPYPPVHFDQAGLVTLGCNIHDEMLAYVVVTDAPFFGRTAASGSWSTEAPSGAYRISIWHPRIRDEAKDLEREIAVTDSNGGLTLHLQRPLKPAPLEGRPHSWDSY